MSQIYNHCCSLAVDMLVHMQISLMSTSFTRDTVWGRLAQWVEGPILHNLIGTYVHASLQQHSAQHIVHSLHSSLSCDPAILAGAHWDDMLARLGCCPDTG